MRTITAVSALALMIFAPSAYAADLSYKDKPIVADVAPTSWTGFYIGANGGYGENASSLDASLDAVKSWDGSDSTITRHAKSTILGADPTGFLFGGQAGYLYQVGGGNLVIGTEFSFDGSSIAGDKASTPTVTYTLDNSSSSTWTEKGVAAHHQQLDYVGTLTGIAGISFGNWLPYVKAGLAFGQVQDTVAFVDEHNAAVISRKSLDTGWTAGAGVAWKFTPSWSLAFEWDYYDLGNHSLTYTDNSTLSSSTSATQFTTGNIPEQFWAAKVAVNYQVGGNTFTPLK